MGLNPDRSTTVNKITIKRLIINYLVTLYRDTRIIQQACTRTAKTTPYPSCHRDNIPAKEPPSVAGRLRRVTLTNYTAGPLAVIAAQYTPKKNYKVIFNNNILTGIYLLFKMFLLASFKISCKSFSANS